MLGLKISVQIQTFRTLCLRTNSAIVVIVIVIVEVMLHCHDHLFPAGRKNRELEASLPEQEWMAVSANTGAPHWSMIMSDHWKRSDRGVRNGWREQDIDKRSLSKHGSSVLNYFTVYSRFNKNLVTSMTMTVTRQHLAHYFSHNWWKMLVIM